MRLFTASVLALLINITLWGADGNRSVEVDMILGAEELDLSETPIGIVPGSGIFAAYGNRLVSVEPDSAMRNVEIAIPDSVLIDDFVFAGNTLVMKIDNSLIWTSPASGFDAVTFVDSDYSLCAATDSTVFIFSRDMAMEFNLKRKKPDVSVQLGCRPVEARKLKDGMLLATDKTVLSLFNDEWTLLHSYPGLINAAAFMPDGIFIGTDEGLWRIAGGGVVELLAQGQVRKMYNDNSVLYILDGEGNLLSLSFGKK